MNYHISSIVQIVPLLLVVIILKWSGGGTGIYIFCGLIALAGYVQLFIFYRCPHCREMFHHKGCTHSFCPFCGGKLK